MQVGVDDLHKLSARETQVPSLVAEVCTNSRVTDRLVLSVRTGERHMRNIYVTLGVRSRAEAVSRWLSPLPEATA